MLSRMKMGITVAKKQYDVVGNSVFGKPRRFYRNELYAQVAGSLRRPKYRTKHMRAALQEVVRTGIEAERKRTGVKSKNIVLCNDNMYACHTYVR